MTEAAAPALQPEPAEFLQIFLGIWGESFSQALGQITGSAVPCVVRTEAPPDLTPPGESDFWAAVTCSGSLRGEMILRFADATVLRLAQIFMSEPATPETKVTADHREAVVELLRQVSGIVATAAKARWGEFQGRVEQAVSAPSWPSAGTFWLQIGEQGPNCMALEFGLSAALVAALKAEKAESAKTEAAAAAMDSAKPVPSSAVLPDAGQSPGALDLLMDVQLAMTMRFGARRLLLREVLDLSPGAVVELDRKIQEPVELLLDGKLVARGEVVLIDGSYGLRVTDVSPLDAARPA
jgi:flagellar motor switch protein FliN